MRSIATILLVLLTALAEAEVRFTDVKAFPDIGLEMPALSGAFPEAVFMPHAEAFFVTEPDGSRHLEDRFDTFDLWTARTVRARWRDANGNLLVVARLDFSPPDDPPDTLSTRADFERRLASLAIDPRDEIARNAAVVACAPVDVSEEPVRPRRNRRREIESLFYYRSTNQCASVWAFRPAPPESGVQTQWYMVALVTSPDEDQDAAAACVDSYFLDRVRSLPAAQLPAHPQSRRTRRIAPPVPGEAELLKRDYSLSVANYEDWHSTENGDVVVVDDLTPQWHDTFVSSLTNDLPRFRAAYALSVPSPLAATTNVAAVRVFSEREEYLGYIEDGAEWSAAVWSPQRRELVLNLQPSGIEDLLGIKVAGYRVL